ncbi:methyl-accepting chemotaxis protein [Massilia sp. CF038]|uniref:methyl-accepting chemotaxis protein n=1 Tax=Massilia sp. CF038 TaxID=1881045 RepID=UPI00090F1DD2|nr:methyl-accepting chemotaxis protein [Massilia sp. CF038]SHG69604.1 Methyl-accepting chemotaxis protein [Massilia sp. CF038]
MPALRPLDTRRKLYFCFALLCCINTAIVLGVLSQCTAPNLLTVAVRQKFSGSAQHIFDLRLAALLALTLSLALTAAMAHWLRRALVEPAELALLIARQAAQGQLDADHFSRPNLKNNELISTMQEMNAFLADIVARTREEGTNVGSSAVDLLRAGRQLAARAQTQGNALQAGLSTSAAVATGFAEQAGQIQGARLSMAAAGRALHPIAPAVAAVRAEIAAIQTGVAQGNALQESIDALALQLNLLAVSAELDANRAGTAGDGLGRAASAMRQQSQHLTQAAQALRQTLASIAPRTSAAGTALARICGQIDDAARTVDCGAQQLRHIEDGNASLAPDIRQLHESIAALAQDAARDAAGAQSAAHTAACLRDQAATLTRILSPLHLGAAHPAAPLIHLAHCNARQPARAAQALAPTVMRVVPPMVGG